MVVISVSFVAVLLVVVVMGRPQRLLRRLLELWVVDHIINNWDNPRTWRIVAH